MDERVEKKKIYWIFYYYLSTFTASFTHHFKTFQPQWEMRGKEIEKCEKF